MKPLLSIVIANYNYGRFLEEAIQSVIAQDMGDQVELIICDAASTDNSVDIIKKYANGLPPNVSYSDWINSSNYNSQTSPLITWWCSESDGGQSAAFNKGFSHARGKYLTWLNADDIVVRGALHKVVLEMNRHPDCQWFTANFYRFLDETRRVFEIGWGPHCYPCWLQRKNSPIVVFGPTSFFSRLAYMKVGGIDTRFHLMMDTDLWVRFMAAGIKQRRILQFCWAFRMHEQSKTAEFGNHRLDEKRKRQFKEENALMYAKTGYSASRILYFLFCVLRILDGSMFLRLIYKCGLIKVKI